VAQPTSDNGNLDWLLDDLVARVPSARQAVVLSIDGLLMGTSRNMNREDAEHLAAVSAGFASLARGTGRRFGGGAVRQTVVEMDSAFLFVSSAGPGACLAVITDAHSDLGLIAYEMAMLVKRVGQILTTPTRSAAGSAYGP
jgi:predicted regulator of Ras-like GTPase activity (Roadblock/LC7/MglB family)